MPLGGQHFLPLIGEVGVLQHGDIGAQIGLVGRIVDARQQRALFDVRAVGEADFRDDAADLAGNVNAGHGLERADRLDARRPHFGAGLLDGDARHGAWLRRDRGLDDRRAWP